MTWYIWADFVVKGRSENDVQTRFFVALSGATDEERRRLAAMTPARRRRFFRGVLAGLKIDKQEADRMRTAWRKQ